MNSLLIWLPILAGAAVLFFGSYLLTRYIGIKKLSYRRYFTQAGVFEGESVYLVEEVCNAFFLPLFFVDIEANIYGNLSLDPKIETDGKSMQPFFSRFYLLPFTRIQRKHPVKCIGRGYYQLETIHIYFASTDIHLAAPAEIYVYPRTLPVEEAAALDREIQNNALAMRNLIDDPFSLSGLRDYRRGDPFGSINFKATAKTGTLKVNEHDPLSNRNFMVYINYQKDEISEHLTSGEYDRLMERALSYAAYLTKQAIERGYKAGFSSNAQTADWAHSIRLPRGGGTTHYEEILRAMAKVKNETGISFVPLVEKDIEENMTGTEVFIFTLYLDERIRDAASSLRRLGNTVTVRCLEPSEEGI